MAYVPNVNFDKAAHKYTVNGEQYPSVTEIVSPLGADYDEPDELTEGILDAATERGTVMHDYIAFRLLGGDPAEYEMPDIYADWAQSVDQFLAEHSVRPYCIERPMAVEYDNDAALDYAGTPDLVCEFDGADAILDWKFVSKVAKSKVGAQLAGYMQLCCAQGVFPERLCAVQFTRSGYRLYQADRIDSEKAWRLCVDVFRLKNMKHPRGRIF